ncbi:hypothetical protein [Streptomyces sp. NPDC020983]|uniref:hypothetical protein n=1 Tax=Streptomyces sp. NPDC020983 TaxID=3365106 RepID=UPI00378BDD4C
MINTPTTRPAPAGGSPTTNDHLVPRPRPTPDDGIDVKVTAEAGLFQLKYYPDGFPGSLKGRRTAIKKSFTRALKHDPVEWTLVVPCTLSPSERAFIEKARRRQVGDGVHDGPAQPWTTVSPLTRIWKTVSRATNCARRLGTSMWRKPYCWVATILWSAFVPWAHAATVSIRTGNWISSARATGSP